MTLKNYNLRSYIITYTNFDGIRVVRKNEKLECLKLASFAEVGKSHAKLERTERNWKELIEVGKFELKLESKTESGK